MTGQVMTVQPGASSQRRMECTVNGAKVVAVVSARHHLVDFLRDQLGLTGSHLGCEQGICGACTVRVDGVAVRGCLMLAVQADGAAVETIEGLTESGEIADLQDAFVARNALQCGYCTAGILVTAADLLRQDARALDTQADRDAVRRHLSGNYCRCTGYEAIVDALCATIEARRRDAKGAPHP